MSRVAALVLMTLAGLPVAALVIYDLTVFQPHRAEIQALVASAEPEDRTPPASVAGLLRTSIQDRSCVAAARQLLFTLNLVDQARGSLLGWQGSAAMWSILACLHLSDADRMTLVASLSYAGAQDKRGLSAASRTVFSRSLSQLAIEEQAQLVALTINPYLIDQEERRAKYGAALLARYQSQQR